MSTSAAALRVIERFGQMTGMRRVTVQAKDANGTYYKQTVYITAR